MRIFGFDIGTTSIGFAAIDLDEDRGAGQILRLGSRIFPEARDPDGTPLNQQRRAKRMMRRQLRRRRTRRRALNELLSEHGLLPPYNSAEWANVSALDPYALRAKALAEPLAPHELGRALYHLAKRRHFKERDLAETGAPDDAPDETAAAAKRTRKGEKRSEAPQSEEEKKEQEEANRREHFVATLKASGQTIGQALASRGPSGPTKGGPQPEPKRGEHATRAVVEDEFDRIVAAQRPHHAALEDGAFVGALREAVFSQRPVFWRKSTLGACRLVPGAALCPKGSWLSQQRVMLEKLNNLEIAGGNRRPLTPDERGAILAKLSTQAKMSWPGVRAAIEPLFKARGESTKYLKFNLEIGDERGGLKGNVVEAALAKIFGDGWAAYPFKDALRATLPDALWRADYGEVGTQRVVIRPEKERAEARAALALRLARDFGASPTQAAAMGKLHFPQGWEPFSTTALERILPELERGVRFGQLIASSDPVFVDWRERAFPDRERPTGEVFDRLPSPSDRDEQRRLASIRNPTVVRVQNELRKVVNNLIDAHGKPDLIRIELAREIGLSKKEREERMSRMRANERDRKAALANLQENHVPNPERQIEAWLLWKESGETDPYTGDKISFDQLFGQRVYQIEHIWPRSWSFDDSFSNKTLCRIDVNKQKGNRTPYEYLRSNPEAWAEAKDRIWKMVVPRGVKKGKARRFCAEEISDEFKKRQLTDTAYAAKQSREMLQRLWTDAGARAPNTVQTVPGRVTAKLRKLWLNHILGGTGEKNRSDHRHHAIDALVVACAHGGLVAKLAHYLELEDLSRKEGKAPPTLTDCPPPWETIRNEVEKLRAADAIPVSHRVRKKVSGPLHLETTYGDTGLDEKKGSTSYRLFVTRKPVERLTKGELDRIVDDRVRTVVQDWVAANGGDPKKAFGKGFPRIGEAGAPIRKVRLRMPQQLSLMAPVSTGYADRGENHHVAIWRTPDGKVDYEVVSLFEAARRLNRREPIVRRARDGATFLMSLSRGDALRFPEGKMHGVWIVQGVWAAGPIVLWRAEDATGASVYRPNAASIVGARAVKIAVDPIGRIRSAND